MLGKMASILVIQAGLESTVAKSLAINLVTVGTRFTSHYKLQPGVSV